MTDASLSAFRDAFRRFVNAEVKPFHAQWEKDGQVPRALWEKAGAAGFLCIPQAEAYGGQALSFRYAAVVQEELARVHASGVAFSLHSDIVAPYLESFAGDALKARYLPAMAKGTCIAAIAMTEPGTGSDLQAVSTRAELQDGQWVISGAKTFVSNGQLCDVVVVVARTEEERGWQGLSLLAVPTSTPGFVRGKRLEKIGMHAQDTSEMSFENCRVPADHLIGERGMGFAYLMQKLAQERLVIAVANVAAARAVLDDTVVYVKERQAFGRAVAAFQNTRFRLAEMATEVELGDTFVQRCVDEIERGDLTPARASMAKYWCSEMLGRVADGCLQLFGGYGYMMEYPVARAYLDARVQRIYGGTTEIMKEIIARDLVG